MRDRIDAPAGRAQYARRFATAEPVFANLCANKRLDRFTRRGRATVDTQWQLIASCTTSRRSRTTDTPPDEARGTDLLRSGLAVHGNLAGNSLLTASRLNGGFCSGRSHHRVRRAPDYARRQHASRARATRMWRLPAPTPPGVAALSVGIGPSAAPADGLRRALRARVRPVAPRGRAGGRHGPRVRRPAPRWCATAVRRWAGRGRKPAVRAPGA